jgi:transcriptional regulator with XRE-family HTH domain
MPKTSEYEQLRRALVRARQEKGHTQSDIAARLGKPQSYVSKYESGERGLDVVEFLELCAALSVSPHLILNQCRLQTADYISVLDRWQITEYDLTGLVDENPSLRGMMIGYIAEKKFHDTYLEHADISEKAKDDDHDRKKKGDRRVVYKGKQLTIEVKSLQTKTVKQLGPDKWHGKAQVDASDRRMIRFSDGTELNTTLLKRGEFDVLAVNCFAFGEQWRFVFAKNSDLPHSIYNSYTDAQRRQLIASLVAVKWPPEPPFTKNLFAILDELTTSNKKK